MTNYFFALNERRRICTVYKITTSYRSTQRETLSSRVLKNEALDKAVSNAQYFLRISKGEVQPLQTVHSFTSQIFSILAKAANFIDRLQSFLRIASAHNKCGPYCPNFAFLKTILN